MKKISLILLLLLVALSFILCNSDNTEYSGSYVIDKESMKEKILENSLLHITPAVIDALLSQFDKISLEIKKDNTFSIGEEGAFTSGTIKQIDKNTLELIPSDENQPHLIAKIVDGKIVMKYPEESKNELILSKKK